MMTAPQCTDVAPDFGGITLHRHDCPHRLAERPADAKGRLDAAPTDLYVVRHDTDGIESGRPVTIPVVVVRMIEARGFGDRDGVNVGTIALGIREARSLAAALIRAASGD